MRPKWAYFIENSLYSGCLCAAILTDPWQKNQRKHFELFISNNIHHTDFFTNFVGSTLECQQRPTILLKCGHQHLLTSLCFLHGVLVLHLAFHGSCVIVLFKQPMQRVFKEIHSFWSRSIGNEPNFILMSRVAL